MTEPLPYKDLDELAEELARAIVDRHGDVLLGYDLKFGDREFAVDGIAEVIKRTVLAKGLPKA